MPKYPYEVVADTIRERIYDGTYPPGSKLPSRTALCKEFEVSDIVVGAATRELKREGLTETLPGIGLFVVKPLPPRPPAAVTRSGEDL